MPHFSRLSSLCFVLISLSLVAGAAHAQLPDVQVTSIELIPANPVAGETVNVFVRIHNYGSVSTPTGVPVGVGVQVDGAYTGSFFVRNINGTGPTRPLQAGHPYRWKISPAWTATAGNHQICAFADDVDRFAETNENNNSSCINVTVPQPTALPDTVVNYIDFSQPNPAPGDTVSVLVGIENVGSVSTPSGVVVGTGVQVDGVYLGAFFARNGFGQTIPLAGGQNEDGQVSWTATVGSHQICAIVDDIDRYSESNENNNSRCVTVNVSPQVLPDVVIDPIYLIPSNPTAGQTVQVTAWIKNQGNADTPTGVAVGSGIQIDGAFAGSFFVRKTGGALDILRASISSPGSVNWVATSGSHQFCAVADDIDRFAESDENNNSSCITVTVP